MAISNIHLILIMLSSLHSMIQVPLNMMLQIPFSRAILFWPKFHYILFKYKEGRRYFCIIVTNKHDLPPRAVICVYEIALLGLKGVVARTDELILQDEAEGSNEILEADNISIYEAEVSGLVQVDGINLNVIGLGEGGSFVAHKPPREGANLI